MPTLRVPGFLSRYAGGRTALPAHGPTVGTALRAAAETHPELAPRLLDGGGRLHPYLVVFLNGAELPRAGLHEFPVSEGDALEVVGAAEGGSAERVRDDADVRMRGFERRCSVEEARRVALEGAAELATEDVPVSACAGRLLAADVRSTVDVPGFRRAAMDGYALRGEDTFGASAYDPVAFELVAEVLPGAVDLPAVGPRQACRIMTGAPVPEGADAVLPAELAREDAARRQVFAEAAVPPGKNVGQVGEDVRAGDLLLPAGRCLRPQDAGLLASVGCHPVAVVARPRVRLVVTGSELLAPGERPFGHRIVDSNTPMLVALVERDGGTVEQALRLPDDEEAIAEALSREGADVILASGGTSVGSEDYLPGLLRRLGELPVHGIAMRPSSPTGIGRIGRAKVFLLPGNPVSCLAAYDFFAGPHVRQLARRSPEWPYLSDRLPLRSRLVSEIGRTDYVRVAVRDGAAEPIASAGASVLTSTTRADGFTVVPDGSEGFPEGERVRVWFYGP